MTPLEALQRTLAGEHAALHVYGVLGGRVSIAAEPRLAAVLAEGYALHRERRDRLVAMVRALDPGTTPAAAAASYEIPTPALSPAQCRAAARVVESRCAATYAAMVGSTARAQRQWAIDALDDAAVRALRLGAAATAFPGAPEL